MDPILSDDMEAFVDEPSKQLHSPYSAYLNGINGGPDVLPRVGDQFQADIPAYDTFIRCFESEPRLHNLPVPLMWSKSEKFRGFREAESEKRCPSSDFSFGKPEPPAASLKPRVIVLALPCQRNAKLKSAWLDKSLYPFPGTLGESWVHAEQERFLLGLYCFGKNLALVQRFVGSKQMGDMLSYYYSRFYSSNEYRRWVDGRKLRSRRSVQGHKLLSGWRQQELLSRISSHVSEECKSKLLEASKEFREDKVALEDYVFTLKNTVGTDMLTEVIGIGKGKRDLTNCVLKPTKLNHGATGNSEVQIHNPSEVDDLNVALMRGEHIGQDQTLKLFSTSSFATDSSYQRNEDREISPEISEAREDFDLNVSQISLEHEDDGTGNVITDVVENSESSCAEQSSVHMDAGMQCKPQEMQENADLLPGRRQSTRTRSLTTKALEAFAYGDLDLIGNSKKKRKASEESRSK